MEGKEALVRAYGAREIGAGILCLSVDKQAGLWSRVAGDGVDIATLLTGMRSDNPKRDNVMLALAVVLGVTVLDVVAAQATTSRHSRAVAASSGPMPTAADTQRASRRPVARQRRWRLSRLQAGSARIHPAEAPIWAWWPANSARRRRTASQEPNT